jgi:hypothetical protein
VFAIPPASGGTIYKSGASGSSRQAIAENEMIYYDKSPSISDLTFESRSNRNIQLSYTAFTASGDAYAGKITLKRATLPDGWARYEVGSLAKRGVVPDALLSNYGDVITRAEFTALLVRTYDYAGAPDRGAATRTAAFADIRGNPYARQISRGFSLMIIDGVSATQFDPDSPLTREAAAKILCATIGQITGPPISSGVELPFADRGSISDWAQQFVKYAFENLLMSGDDANRFRPQDNLSREEAMALVERAIVNYGF